MAIVYELLGQPTYNPIITTSSMKIFILSTTTLYTNKAKESTDLAKKRRFFVF